MKTIRLIISNPFVVVLLLLVFVNYSFASPTKKTSLNNISGEELFKSIYYADGKVASQIESLNGVRKIVKSLNEKDLTEYRMEQLKVIDYLKSKNSNYFIELKNVIQSKNAKEVEVYLNSTNNIIKNYIDSQAKEKGIDVEKLVKEYKNDLHLNANQISSPNSVALALIITIVIVIGIAVAVTMTKIEVSDPMEVQITSLNHQKYISEIVALS